MDEARRAAALAEVDRLSALGYRTLGVAYRTVDVEGLELAGDLDESWEHGLVYLGVVGIIDPPRAEAAVAVGEAHRARIRTVMITGDHPVTARGSRLTSASWARKPWPSPVRSWTGSATRSSAHHPGGVGLRPLAPGHKLRIVVALQDDRHIVAMTGDGVDDAPA